MQREMKISFDELMEILDEELPVYGDFLKFFKIELGLLPISKGTPLFRVGSLYSKLKDMHCGMLYAYAMLAMLKSGFVDLPVVELAKEDGKDEPEAFEWGRDYMREMGIEETIYCPFHEGLLGVFINTENPKEAIHVLGICMNFSEVSSNDEIIIMWPSTDDLIEKLNKDVDKKSLELDLSSVESISDFIIIDPLLFRACKEEINSLKQEIEDKIGKDIVKHPSEFLSMLTIDHTDFDAEWSSLRAKALADLKDDYEFLSLYEEKEAIYEAQKDMREAEIDIEEEKYRDAVGKAGRACEGMLRVLYHAYKKKPAEEKASFDSMLNKLREEILDDFEEDVFTDLNYIRQWRNAAVHPKPQRIKSKVAVKVIRKAQLFQELFFRKTKGRL